MNSDARAKALDNLRRSRPSDAMPAISIIIGLGKDKHTEHSDFHEMLKRKRKKDDDGDHEYR